MSADHGECAGLAGRLARHHGTLRLAEQRIRFEAWFSEDGKWPRAVERRDGHYILAQAASAWRVWQVAVSS